MVSEKMVAWGSQGCVIRDLAAYGEQRAAVLHEGGELRALGQKALAHDALLAVGAAAYEGDVGVGEARRLAEVHLLDDGLYAAPCHAAAQHQDVSRVAVEVQQLGEEMDDLEAPRAHSRSPSRSSSALAGQRAE